MILANFMRIIEIRKRSVYDRQRLRGTVECMYSADTNPFITWNTLILVSFSLKCYSGVWLIRTISVTVRICGNLNYSWFSLISIFLKIQNEYFPLYYHYKRFYQEGKSKKYEEKIIMVFDWITSNFDLYLVKLIL